MKGLETHPEILEIVKTEKDTYAFGNVWHSDGSFTEIPPKATMLYAQERHQQEVTRCLQICIRHMIPYQTK